MSSYAPPFARVKRARPTPRPTQAAAPLHERYTLDELVWDEHMNKDQLVNIARRRGIRLPEKITRSTITRRELIQKLEENDESQPKDVMAALRARETQD